MHTVEDATDPADQSIGQAAPDWARPRCVLLLDRMIFDVLATHEGHVVVRAGIPLTEPATCVVAAAQARSLAEQVWREGRRALVRRIGPNGCITPLIAFG